MSGGAYAQHRREIAESVQVLVERPQNTLPEYVRMQHEAALEDAQVLCKASGLLTTALTAGDMRRAANAARAWSAYAGGIARRLDEAMAYLAGAQAQSAAQQPAEVWSESPILRGAVHQAGGVIAFRVPRAGRRQTVSVAVRRYDCGPAGALTVHQMAERSGLCVAAIYSRLRRGWAPEQAACTPSRRGRKTRNPVS